MRKFYRASGIALFAIAACCAKPADALVLFSNLGPGNSYSIGAYELSSNQSLAMEFTPSVTARITEILIPASYSEGVNAVRLSLVTDNGGLPEGTTLVSDLLNGAVTNAVGGGLLTWNPSSSVTVSAGQTYWAVFAPGDPTFRGAWFVSPGGPASFATALFGGGWIRLDGSIPPALRVDGVTAPEPVSSGLFGVGLLLMCGARRRRSSIGGLRTRLACRSFFHG